MPSYMIRPFTITGPVGGDTVLSTTATDPTPAWTNVASFDIGDASHVGDTVYISLIDDNVGNSPANNPSKWLNNGPINPLAMFDGATSTQTEAEETLTVVVQLSGWLDGLAFFDLVGTAMHVKIEDGASTVYDEEISLLDDEVVVDFYTYLFEELTYVRDLALMNLPLTPNAKVTVTITGGGTVKCGAMVAGSQLLIGDALQGSTAGIENFSIVERNAYGTLAITPRNTAKEGSFEVVVPDGRGPSINNAFRDLGSRVAVFVMAEGDSRAVILGFISSYKFTWGQRNDERLSLEVSGVT